MWIIDSFNINELNEDIPLEIKYNHRSAFEKELIFEKNEHYKIKVKDFNLIQLYDQFQIIDFWNDEVLIRVDFDLKADIEFHYFWFNYEAIEDYYLDKPEKSVSNKYILKFQRTYVVKGKNIIESDIELLSAEKG